MTTSNSDAEHDARVLAAMDYAPTPDEELRTDAGSDQIDAARREADGYGGMFLPSGERHPELRGLTAVYEMGVTVMANYRAAVETNRLLGLETVKEWVPPMPGVGLPTFDINDPACQRGLFLIFAGTPHVLHSMRFDTVEQLVARELQHSQGCDWQPVGPQCASYATEFLMIARGSFLVATAICWSCKKWLLAGAPDPVEFGSCR
ncbi:MAG: hypothetical protein AB7G47_21285 [Mycolicibacterium sp.]|uniref:hypothetical protein n=1 Tax=Mycolicibacterium sp. TaxID=2320850 RepID=UPI003D0D0F74